jgi:hypothetical protein
MSHCIHFAGAHRWGENQVTNSTLVYDPSSYELHENPFPVYRRMQDEAPLYRNSEHHGHSVPTRGALELPS